MPPRPPTESCRLPRRVDRAAARRPMPWHAAHLRTRPTSRRSNGNGSPPYDAGTSLHACTMHDARCTGQDTTGSMRRAVNDVQRNTYSRQAAFTVRRSPRAQDTPDRCTSSTDEGASVPTVLRTARTMPWVALTVRTRGTVARRQRARAPPAPIGEQRMPATWRSRYSPYRYGLGYFVRERALERPDATCQRCCLQDSTCCACTGSAGYAACMHHATCGMQYATSA